MFNPLRRHLISGAAAILVLPTWLARRAAARDSRRA